MRAYTFVDVETTGFNSRNDRVIEVAAVKVVDGDVVEEFETLLNPDVHIPRHIEQITGIKVNDVLESPRFEDIAGQLSELFESSVMVAHNCGFDYSFLKSEFSRVGMDFAPERLCTVKLSRNLFPDQKSHSLDSVIAQHNISISDRHRAMADVMATMEFFNLAEQATDVEAFHEALGSSSEKLLYPKNVKKKS